MRIWRRAGRGERFMGALVGAALIGALIGEAYARYCMWLVRQ